MNEQSVHNLYKNLQSRYGFKGTEQAFIEKLQDEQNRRTLFDNLQKQIGFKGTYDAFNSRLGFDDNDVVRDAGDIMAEATAQAEDAKQQQIPYLYNPQVQEEQQGQEPWMFPQQKYEPTATQFENIPRPDDFSGEPVQNEKNAWLTQPYRHLSNEELAAEIVRLENPYKERADEMYKKQYGKTYEEMLQDNENYAFGKMAKRFIEQGNGKIEAEAKRLEDEENPEAIGLRDKRLNAIRQEQAWRAHRETMPKLMAQADETDRKLQYYEEHNDIDSGAQRRDLNAARHLLRQSKNLLNAPSVYGNGNPMKNWWQGLSDQLGDYDTWTAGVTELWRMGNLNGIVNKLNEGEKITPEEELVLESFLLSTAAQEARGDVSKAYTIGKGSAESIPFMAEMFLTAGAGAGAKKGLVTLAERKVGKEFAEKLARCLGGTVITDKAGRAIEMGATKTLKGEVGKTLAYDFVQTAAMPSTWANVYEDRVNEILNGDGKFDYKDFARSFTNSWVETGTERWGGRIIDKSVAKVIPFDATKIWGNNKAFGQFVQNYINSPLGETGEEYIGAIINRIRAENPFYRDLDDKSIMNSDQFRKEFEHMMSPEGFTQTFLTILPMSFGGGAANAVINKIATSSAIKDYGKSKEELKQLLIGTGATDEQADNIISQIEMSTSDGSFKEKMDMTYSQLLTKHLLDNPNESESDAKKFKAELEKQLGGYVKNAVRYNQLVGDMMEAYEGLSDEDKAKFNDALNKNMTDIIMRNFDKQIEEAEKQRQEEQKKVEQDKAKAQAEADKKAAKEDKKATRQVLKQQPKTLWAYPMTIEMDGAPVDIKINLPTATWNEDGSLDLSKAKAGGNKLMVMRADGGSFGEREAEVIEKIQQAFMANFAAAKGDALASNQNKQQEQQPQQGQQPVTETSAAETPVVEPQVEITPEQQAEAERQAEEQRVQQVVAELDQQVATQGTKVMNGWSFEQQFLFTMTHSGLDAAVEDAIGWKEDAQNEKNRTKKREDLRQVDALLQKYAPQNEAQPVVEDQTEQPEQPAQEQAEPIQETTEQEVPAEEQPQIQEQEQEQEQEPQVDYSTDDVVLMYQRSGNNYVLCKDNGNGTYTRLDNGKPLGKGYVQTEKRTVYDEDGTPYVLLSIIGKDALKVYNGNGRDKTLNVVNMRTGERTAIPAENLYWQDENGTPEKLLRPSEKRREAHYQELIDSAKTLDDVLDYVLIDNAKTGYKVTLRDLMRWSSRSDDDMNRVFVGDKKFDGVIDRMLSDLGADEDRARFVKQTVLEHVKEAAVVWNKLSGKNNQVSNKSTLAQMVRAFTVATNNLMSVDGHDYFAKKEGAVAPTQAEQPQAGGQEQTEPQQEEQQTEEPEEAEEPEQEEPEQPEEEPEQPKQQPQQQMSNEQQMAALENELGVSGARAFVQLVQTPDLTPKVIADALKENRVSTTAGEKVAAMLGWDRIKADWLHEQGVKTSEELMEEIDFQKGDSGKFGSRRAGRRIVTRLKNAGLPIEEITDDDLPRFLGEKYEELRGIGNVVYGFYNPADGTIYLLSERINPNTPIHEYTHLWVDGYRTAFPEQWKAIKEELKKDAVWGEVMADKAYADIRENEDAVASEVMSRLMGDYWSQTNAFGQTRADMTFEEKGHIARLKSLFRKFVNSIATKFFNKDLTAFKGKKYNEQLQALMQMPMADLIEAEKVAGQSGETEVEVPELELMTGQENGTIFVGREDVPRNEFAVAYEALFKKRANGETGTTMVFSANYAHIFEGSYYRAGIPIENNEEIIKQIRKEYGVNGESETFNSWIEDFRNHRGQRGGNTADASGQRRTDGRVDGLYGIDQSKRRADNAEGNRAGRNTGQGVALTEEEQRIKDEAIRRGDFMQAPKGEPTLLNEKQWLQVRTDAFKNWFGDWQNDPENASKVLDVNGEPMVVYRGSKNPSSFTFRSSYGDAYFFTDNKQVAEHYARRGADHELTQEELDARVQPVFLNVRNNSEYDAEGRTWQNVFSTPRYQVVGEDGDVISEFQTREQAEAYCVENGLDPEIDINETNGASGEIAQQDMADGQYDGVLFRNMIDGTEADESDIPSNVWVVEENTQAKSATQNVGTFDKQNPDIRFMVDSPDPYTIDEQVRERQQRNKERIIKEAKNETTLPAQTLGGADRMIYEMQDNTWGIHLLQEKINKWRNEHGKEPIPESMDVRSQLVRMNSVIGNKIRWFEEHEVETLRDIKDEIEDAIEWSPLMEKFSKDKLIETKKNGKTFQHINTPETLLERYLIARDGIERAKMHLEGREIDTRGEREFVERMGASMVEYAEMFENLFPKEQIDALWNAVRACTRTSLRAAFESERIDEDYYNYLMERQFYVPEKGDAETVTNEDLGEQKEKEREKRGGKKGLNTSTEQKARGGSSMASQVFEYMIQDAENNIAMGERNKVRMSMYNLMKDNLDYVEEYGLPRPQQEWFVKIGEDADGNPIYKRSLERPDDETMEDARQGRASIREMNAMIEGLRKNLRNVEKNSPEYEDLTARINNAEEMVARMRNMLPVVTSRNTPMNTISDNRTDVPNVEVFIKGERHVMTFNGMKEVADALNEEYNLDMTMSFWKKINAGLASIMTTYNPSFFMVNIARDVPYIVKKGSSEYGFEFAARYSRELAPDKLAVNSYVIGQYLGGRLDTSTEDGKLFYDFIMGGGNTGYTQQRELKELNKMLKNHHLVGPMMTLAKNLNEYSELLTRYSAYKAVLKMGRSENDALNAAKNLSTNFNMRGAGNKFLNAFNSLSMFSNAAIQGATGLWKTFLGNPKQVARAFANMAVMPAFMGFLNTILYPDDPDKERMVSQYYRDNYLVLGPVKIPLPQESRPFWRIGVNIAMQMQGNRTRGEAIKSLLSGFMEYAVPLPPVITQTLSSGISSTGENIDDSAVQVAANMLYGITMPQYSDAVKQLISNKDFMGNKIRKEYDWSDTPQYKMNPNEAELFKEVAQVFYDVSGGDADNPSKYLREEDNMVGDKVRMDISPKELRIIASSVVGSGQLQLLCMMCGLSKSFMTGTPVKETVRPKDIFGAGSFYRPENEIMYRLDVYNSARRIEKEYTATLDSFKKNAVKAKTEEERNVIIEKANKWRKAQEAKGLDIEGLSSAIEMYKNSNAYSRSYKEGEDSETLKKQHPEWENMQKESVAKMNSILMQYKGLGEQIDELDEMAKRVPWNR